MYEIDQYAMEKGGISGERLMENAGRQIADRLIKSVTLNQRIAILIGGGNNGGDGFVIARFLKEAGYPISVFQVVKDEKIRGDAKIHKHLLQGIGVRVELVLDANELEQKLMDHELVIDAMLGIGITGSLREPIRSIIEVVNQSNLRIIAVDIPSGLPANDQVEVDAAIAADQTYIVEAPKQTVFIEPTNSYYGDWQVVSIGIPIEAFLEIGRVKRWDDHDVKRTLPQRDIFSHKGSHGRGLVIGGQLTMPGSITLTANAALRSGAGLLTIATIKELIPIIANQCTEATYHILSDEDGKITGGHLTKETYDAVAIGMGMGRSQRSSDFIKKFVRKIDKPVIIDADGLYHISNMLEEWKPSHKTIILTPHYGELAMLTGYSVSDIKKAPFTISREFAAEYQVYLILKGKYTIITTPDGRQSICDKGNTGLAKGGTGDVLSGILLTMVMQHDNVSTALNNGCFVHGKSAELLVKRGKHTERDMLASDVIEGISHVFRTFS